jgi:hypothetical protein
MAGICTANQRRNGPTCGHFVLDVVLDGETHSFHDLTDSDLNGWDAKDKRQFILLGLKRQRSAGMSLADAMNKVIVGEEGTNVRVFPVLSKDVTKTNIGTTYVNVPPGLNGERTPVDFTGCTQYRVVLNMNAIGTGPWSVRMVRDTDLAVLWETTNISGAGEKEVDTDWQTLPAAASGMIAVRLQGRSNVGADDPVFRRAILLVR